MTRCLVFVALLTGCSKVPPPASGSAPSVNRIGLASGGTTVDRVVDKELGVVCYVSYGFKSGGISCLPLMEPQP